MIGRFSAAILVFALCTVPADADNPFQPFPGPAYGVKRTATPEEQELLEYAKAKGDFPSQYMKIATGEYLVVIRAMMDLNSGIYYAAPKSGSYHLLVSGSVDAVETRQVTEKMRWILVSSGSMHMGHGWKAYYALVFFGEPSAVEPSVIELGEVSLDYTAEDQSEPRELRYSITDINRDGIEDIALHIKDGKSVTDKQFIVTRDGIREQP